MTDAAKWKSVMLRVDSYDLLKQIAVRDRRSIASILNELIQKEWEWHFGVKNQETQHQVVKDPERRVNNHGPRNPFLARG